MIGTPQVELTDRSKTVEPPQTSESLSDIKYAMNVTLNNKRLR